MSEQTAFPTMEKLMARVGYLLLHWGRLENEVRKAGGRVSDLANEQSITFARDIRNLVAHGMVGASADANCGAQPFITCRAQDGKERTVTYAELSTALDLIHAHCVVVGRSSGQR